MHKLFYHKARLIIQDSMSNQNYEPTNYNRIDELAQLLQKRYSTETMP
jgi:glutamate formiminotransferase